MFTPDRRQARQLFFETWRKAKAGEPLSPLEAQVLDILHLHPEYRVLLDHPERNLERDFDAATGEPNPFLHLALHLAVAEQLSIAQPHGLAERYRGLVARMGDAHAALHVLMECLAETLWQAQHGRGLPDASVYLACVDRMTRA